MSLERRMRRYAMRHEKLPDSFEIAKTFGKIFVLLIFLIPAGIVVAMFIVEFL